MANTAGRPNSNNSQFFITFGEASWLHKKHTIFGKVTGNTVFNLMRVNDVEVCRVRVCVTSASASASANTTFTHSLALSHTHSLTHPLTPPFNRAPAYRHSYR
jgi:cyclophilin family peptidyl-prolyl cis-trans isomerase